TYAGNLIADLKENEYSSTSILKSASNTQSQALVALEKTGEYAANLKNKYKVSNWYTELFTDKNLDILMSQNSEVKGKKDYLKRLALEGIMSMIQERPNAQQSWYAASPLIQSYFQTQDGNYNVNYQALSKYLSDNFNNIHKNYSGTGPIGPGTTKYNIISQLLDDIFNYQGIISGKDNLSGSVADSYAAGSLYTQGGLSSISEFGPELYATPGLSGAALIPEGSKVLPTTATKGLWELGNFANEFIKPLRSLGGLGSSSSTVFGADESTNINTLNITLRADKDFDADKFIQQLKALQAISKNN
ncbi:MAG: hypothetical protein J6Z11_12185, partial [Candidatus Riflebacteria bacterium]|nr:hypothetical protein [Candidatus Riflebacteria bacterium]